MKAKIIRRPLRIFTKKMTPYIIYKDKKYNLKSTEIDNVLKFINKLHKKTKKKVNTNKQQKKDIKQYIDGKIRLYGGPSSNSNNNDLINKENELINKLNNITQKIESDKNEIKMIKQKQNDLLSIKDDTDKLIEYDDINNTYNIDIKGVSISGDTKQEVKQKLVDQILKLYQKYNYDIDKFQKMIEKQKNDFNIKEDEFKLQVEKQKNELQNKEKTISDVSTKLENKEEILIRKERYDKLIDKSFPINKLNDLSIKLTNENRDSMASFNRKYNEFYKLDGDNIYPLTKKLDKKKYVNYLLDKEDELNEKNNLTIQKVESGDGNFTNNKSSFGLWNYQIDKIMKPFKLYIKTISIDGLNDMMDYIYYNNILNGSFILNIGQHWISIYYDFENEYVVEIYNPFGDVMNDKVKNIIINEFKKLILRFEINVFIKIKINNIQQQDINSSNCGWFSMYFLIMRFNNYTFKYITKFNDVKEDEKHIELLKDKYDKFGFI